MRRGARILALLAAACGGASSTIPDAAVPEGGTAIDGGPPSSLDGAASDDGPVEGGNASGLVCDEAADCKVGVCCAELETSGPGKTVVTGCRDTCITNLPRFQVCKTDVECESKSCKAYACAPGPALRYCDKPFDCQ